MFAHVSADAAAGLLQTFGVPEIMENEDHIQVNDKLSRFSYLILLIKIYFKKALKYQIHTVYLPQVNICEFYQCDIEKYVNLFTEAVSKSYICILKNLYISQLYFRCEIMFHPHRVQKIQAPLRLYYVKIQNIEDWEQPLILTPLF